MTSNLDTKQNTHFERVVGTVDRVIYTNTENGYNVLEVKVKGISKPVTVVGSLGPVNPGEVIEAIGSWKLDKTYGRQFSSTFIKTNLPSDIAGIKKYLASGMIYGIGEHYADLIVNTFKEDTIAIINEDVTRLGQVRGIGAKRLKSIQDSWQEQKVIKDLMLFLHSSGIGSSLAIRIYRKYGQDAVSQIKENPYILSQEVSGIGFATADKIAQSLDIELTSPFRVKAGITYVLQDYSNQGSSAVPKTNLLKDASILLNLPKGLIETTLLSLVQEDKMIVEVKLNDLPAYSLSYLFHSEKAIAQKLIDLHKAHIPLNIDFEESINFVEQDLKIILADKQKEAIKSAIDNNVVVITGGPGTGKTTILNSLIRILKKHNLKVSLCAPTGKAAKRMSQVSGVGAQTIHRLLGISFPGCTYSNLKCDVLIIDEMSMVNINIMFAVCKSMEEIKRLVLVGDANQLPPIGPGKVLQDIIESKVLSVVTLDKIFRQAQTSKIITNAHKINNGQMPDLQNADDFYFIRASSDINRYIISCIERLKKNFDPLRDIQVIAPMQKGETGVIALNQLLQKSLNKSNIKITRHGHAFLLGDKVMQIVNNYTKDIYNGDVGIICNIDQENQGIKVNFEGQIIHYDFNELDQLTLSYANTVHKSQGSEYKVVILTLCMEHFIMLKRRLLYTALTRAKEKVIIIGEERAISLAVKSLEVQNRYSKLQNNLVNLITDPLVASTIIEQKIFDVIFEYLNKNISKGKLYRLRFIAFDSNYSWQAIAEEHDGLKYFVASQNTPLGYEIANFQKKADVYFERLKEASKVLFIHTAKNIVDIITINKK
ncbi:SF1B family DNA helicase RecD2 [Candidatus Phycorickettsia trachydisci]|nr:ATP-dependent RecD-like DNA helicase [Candidatus Phycorickettsia trachydisci]